MKKAGDVDAYLLLNPDMRLESGSIQPLVDTVAAPGVGIAVPRLVDQDGGLRYSLRRSPTISRAWGEALLGGDRAGRFAAWGEVITAPKAYATPSRADWATGAAMLISRACKEAVGLWDESYFLYSEETDFALRAADAGFELRYVPDSEFVHHEGESHESPALFMLLTRNRVKLYRARHGPFKTSLFWLGVFTGELLRSGRPTRRAAARALLGRTDGIAAPS
jgi:GT2 family glycosyltransferase